MESHAYKIIPLKELSEDPAYSLRYRLEDEALEKSVRKRGVLQPLTVEARGRIVSGHKRFYAARKLGMKEIPALEILSPQAPQDLFLLAILSNWGQQFTEFEKAWIFHRAASFKIPQAGILEEIAPALGMASEKHLCAHYVEIVKLEKPLLDLMASGRLPFRGSESLLKMPPPDQKVFAAEVAEKIPMTTNQVLNAGQWLYDLMKKEGKDLTGLLMSHGLKEILDSELDGRQKAEQFFQKVRTLRYPRLTEKERQFALLSGQISRQLGPVSFEPPPQFEGQAITLKVKAKTPQSLEELIETLKARRKLLNSLFDIVL